MTRAEAVALIVRALDGDVTAAVAAKLEQPMHADWSFMTQEALHAAAGGTLKILWRPAPTEDAAEEQEMCERALARRGGSAVLSERILRLGGKVVRVADACGAPRRG